MNGSVRERRTSVARFVLAMKHLNHTRWSATAIAAVLALSTTPLAAQDADVPAAEAPAVQPVEPPPPVAVSPVPTIVIPDVTVPAVSGAAAFEPAPEPSATVTTKVTKATAAPATRKTHTVTRTVSQTAPAVVAPVAAVPPPANDALPLPAETIDAAPVAAAPVAAPEPIPAQAENMTGTLGLILLGLLALAILTVGLLFFRRRNPVMSETAEAPLVTRPLAQPPLAEPVAATSMAAPAMLRRRDLNPMTGALASDGAAVDLPARAPESYQERSALIERMVEARPDRANPFTDRKPRLHRARLILQSLGTTFEREPRIDFSQYPNNWPELRQQYRKAA